jgi:XTP/dITP diphosphohydrolase
VRAPVEVYLASSNPGKLGEFRVLASAAAQSVPLALELLPEFAALPAFDENAPTFAENAAGKALHYSRLYDGLILADDSGLVVPALGGAPGVLSARYAGPTATSAERMAKLLAELRGKTGQERRAHFVCAIALARLGRATTVVTDRVDGEVLQVPRGDGGFGYDPIFYFPPLGKTFAELSAEEKNEYSHRGKAFRKVLDLIANRHPS